MPQIELDKQLERSQGDFSPKPLEWYRERLLVFAPGSGRRVVELVVSQIRNVVEMPFLEDNNRAFLPTTDFILKLGGEAEAMDGEILATELERVSEEWNVPLRPQFAKCVNSNDTRPGLFCGTSLFLPDSSNPYDLYPRGRFFLRVKFPGRKGTKPLELDARMQGVGSWDRWSSESPQAGFYRWQNRISVGFDTTLPNVFASIPPHLRDQFQLDRILFLLKPHASGRPTLMEATASGDAGEVAEGSLCSLITVEPVAIRAPTPVALEPDTEFSEIEVSQSCLKPAARESGATATLVIQPNTAPSRLRHSAAKLTKWGYFSVLGIVLPRPSAANDVVEIDVHFSSGGHLLAHGLDLHDASLLIRQRTGWFSRVQDDLILVRGSGRRVFVTGEDFDSYCVVGERGPVLERYTDKATNVSGLINGRIPLGATAIEDGGLDEAYFVLRPGAGKQTLGYFLLPTKFTVRADQVDQPQARESEVRFDRIGVQTTDLGICLDWLDEAVRVVAQTGDSEKTLMGYGEYLQNTGSSKISPLPDHQSIRLLPTKGDPDVLRIHLIEKMAENPERIQPVTPNDLCRIGPLICRYHVSGG